MKILNVAALLTFVPVILTNDDKYLKLPPGLSIGAASAAHQIEGAWNVSDKGLNVWDEFTHRKPSMVENQTNADITSNSYYKYKEDIQIMKDIGLTHYRFSLSWARILPTGFPDKISQDGVQYYKNIIDEVKSKGIEPFVTLYHWDHPALMGAMGSWTNELMVEWFAHYARVVFRELGPKVKFWATVNEPEMYCKLSHGRNTYAPGLNSPLFGEYICLHNLLKAHARAYQIYNDEFRADQGGKVGLVPLCFHHLPASEDFTEAAEIAHQFDCGRTIHPIFSKDGDYPPIVKQRIRENSELEGLPFSRLPEFSPYWINLLRGSADYFGLNHYSTYLVEPVPWSNKTGWYNDSGVRSFTDKNWAESPAGWLKIVPEGFGSLLRLIKEKYGNPPVHVLENGIATYIGHEDYLRINYLHDYMKEMLVAINRDGCNVEVYTVWSLLDSFEWSRGYEHRFGLVEVDFDSPNRTRTPRLSTKWLREMLAKRKLEPLKTTEFYKESVVADTSDQVR